MRVKLIKISSSHNNLRTNEVEGEIEALPSAGGRLAVIGKGLEFGSRLVFTSEIKTVNLIDKNETRDLFHIETQNSEYALEVYSGSGNKAEEADRG